MAYIIEIDTTAASEIRAFPKKDQRLILSKVESLATNPRPPGCIKLAGNSELNRGI